MFVRSVGRRGMGLQFVRLWGVKRIVVEGR